MELCKNESTAAESIKEARAICSHVTLDAEALCFATVKAAKVAYVTHWKIQAFRFSGELVSFKELGQPDLIKLL